MLTIGTHALLESDFAPADLGLVVIDEQHKFGVAQRERLVRKGHYPHLLVVTATPIPRTLALTLYGDLDVSAIHVKPAGRTSIRTFMRTRASLPKVWDFVRQQLAAGRQAYVVLPRVEAEESGEVKAVLNEHRRLVELLSPFRVGLMHGRLPGREKVLVMNEFSSGALPVLLATMVIEVGVDVPNATVMVVENAEQFGLAQLHQLRGRIGRGQHQGYCILVPADDTPEVRARLHVLTETSDGFAVAEADLRLRGAGDLLGKEQSGIPPFRFGDLATDGHWVEAARKAVSGWITRRSRSRGSDEGSRVKDAPPEIGSSHHDVRQR
jgi:ATP-dependent DNA helicase RecG